MRRIRQSVNVSDRDYHTLAGSLDPVFRRALKFLWEKTTPRWPSLAWEPYGHVRNAEPSVILPLGRHVHIICKLFNYRYGRPVVRVFPRVLLICATVLLELVKHLLIIFIVQHCTEFFSVLPIIQYAPLALYPSKLRHPMIYAIHFLSGLTV
ncbi:hypothetical protein F5J12DRAFT_570925 [Pisolithus orientalis]|uniref:uncharacterized protein n=1 Tax=Pisolithus orientalis TaxID=936130 RepID=UPI0022251A08|nr:uncharacterized protein F5J12DRAFT_570925 [Pisolithus orientalis]KAI6010926.1 hypothetical protein F5J12DRAFT_570925 [Pisolithus orientalis]